MPFYGDEPIRWRACSETSRGLPFASGECATLQEAMEAGVRAWRERFPHLTWADPSVAEIQG